MTPGSSCHTWELRVSFGEACSSSKGLHLQEGLSTEVFYSAKTAGAGWWCFFSFLIRFFSCSHGFLCTSSAPCANALTLSAPLLGLTTPLFTFMLCRRCCLLEEPSNVFALLLCQQLAAAVSCCNRAMAFVSTGRAAPIQWLKDA